MLDKVNQADDLKGIGSRGDRQKIVNGITKFKEMTNLRQ